MIIIIHTSRSVRVPRQILIVSDDIYIYIYRVGRPKGMIRKNSRVLPTYYYYGTSLIHQNSEY